MKRIALSVIVVIYLTLAALYAVFTPKWQAPDEPARFNTSANCAASCA